MTHEEGGGETREAGGGSAAVAWMASRSAGGLTSALLPIADAESVVRDVLDRVAGFGPLQRYLDDPEVEEIWVNELTSLNPQVGGLMLVIGPH
jgi:pilus assembly protein CpaF